MDLSSRFVVVLAIAAAMAHAAGAEEQPPTVAPLSNPGFEDGLNGWTRDGWRLAGGGAAVDLDPVIRFDGAQAAVIHHPEPNDTWLAQTIVVQPDTVYRLTGWIQTQRVESAEGTVGASLAIQHTDVRSPDVRGTQSWQRRELWIKTHATQRRMGVMCRLGYGGSAATGMAWFDRLTLELVDPPPPEAEVQLLPLVPTAGLFHARSGSYWAAIAALLLAIGWLWRAIGRMTWRRLTR